MSESSQVKKFFDCNSGSGGQQDLPKLISSTTILIKLIQNAVDKGQEGEKYRRVRLANPKIRSAVLGSVGAVDVLLKAGFKREKDDDNNNETVLVFPDAVTEKQRKVSLDIVHQLTAKLNKLQGKTDSAGFLSHEERQKRQKRAKAEKKARLEQKHAALRQWDDDCETRKEIMARSVEQKNLALAPGGSASAGSGLAADDYAPGPGIVIRKKQKKKGDAGDGGPTASPKMTTATGGGSNINIGSSPTTGDLDPSSTSSQPPPPQEPALSASAILREKWKQQQQQQQQPSSSGSVRPPPPPSASGGGGYTLGGNGGGGGGAVAANQDSSSSPRYIPSPTYTPGNNSQVSSSSPRYIPSSPYTPVEQKPKDQQQGQEAKKKAPLPPVPMDTTTTTSPADGKVATAVEDRKQSPIPPPPPSGGSGVAAGAPAAVASGGGSGGGPDAATADGQPMQVDDNADEKSSSSSGNQYWETCLQHVPRCASAEGIRDTSIYYKKKGGASAVSSSSATNSSCLRRLLRELDQLKDELPRDGKSSIWIRFDEESPQYIRAVVAAALPGPTPYAGGMFCFDGYVPPDYPSVPPQFTLLTTGGGSVRFGPNLYADGKVCLSLLGTWPGPKWNPKLSNLLQVLISIQGLILGVEHPYYLEPGHGGWEGTVKTGDFASRGQTLAGHVVSEDVNVPPHVRLYEDQIRSGTIRYAMLAMMPFSPQPAYLRPFRLPIMIHFYHNKDRISKEVASWVDADRTTTKTSVSTLPSLGAGTPMMTGLPHDKHTASLESIGKQIKLLYAKLQTKLDGMSEPDLTSAEVGGSSVSLLDTKPAAKPDPAVAETTATTTGASSLQEEASDTRKDTAMKDVAASLSDEDNTGNGGGDPTADTIREMMEKAVASGDYVKAGKLQEVMKEVEKTEIAMKEAVGQGNYIRAGKLQEQLQARLSSVQDLPDEIKKKSKPMKDFMPGPSSSSAASGGPPGMMEDMMDDDDYDDDDDDDDDDFGSPMGGMPTGFPAGFPGAGGGGGGALMPGFSFGAKMPKNWFAPPGHKLNTVTNPKHQWGGGQALSAEPAAAAAAAAAAGPSMIPMDTAQPPKPRSGKVCRLRLRLPDSTVLTEEFDGNDTISDVYKRIDPHFQHPASAASDDRWQKQSSVAPVAARTQVMTEYGLHMADAPAFSRPLSLKGYTLLLSRPKREFSLEMDGTKTLEETGLLPSATITVMMCKERGMVRRGDLEDRLSSAQGDAMDVDGLSYEGLVEFTERVGASEKAWGQVEEESLQKNSALISPAQLMGDDSATMSDDENRSSSCPICLGEYDSNDEELNLRQLKTCQHQDNVFHEACLRTWLQTKTSCPICKLSLI